MTRRPWRLDVDPVPAPGTLVSWYEPDGGWNVARFESVVPPRRGRPALVRCARPSGAVALVRPVPGRAALERLWLEGDPS